MVELLAPSGSPESVEAAVQGGANAIYLGYGDFNARRNAKNFSLEELEAAVDYCHLRGVSVFLTLNTLLTQRELVKAESLVGDMAQLGIDAVIVQDLGVANLVRQVAPSIELHASTQMSIHSLDGVKQLEDFGFSRVVLARELSRKELEYISSRSPLELEVFVHGAQCMSYSGQCFLSAMVGQRSGNRGLCAQPCRLAYGWTGGHSPPTPSPSCKKGQKKGKCSSSCGNTHPLSLKDMSLVNHLQELCEMGIASFKLEGRMKRPEYVYIVTKIYSDLLKDQRKPTSEEYKALETAFSRQGFTQGYYQDSLGTGMFGTRQEEAEPRDLFAEARRGYEKQEGRKIPITCEVTLEEDCLHLTFEDDASHRVTGKLEGVEEAKNKALTQETLLSQLQRTGGTPYHIGSGKFQLAPNKALPLSKLNHLRRDLLEELGQLRVQGFKRDKSEMNFPFSSEKSPHTRDVFSPSKLSQHTKTMFTVWVLESKQVTKELLEKRPSLLYLPWNVPQETVHLCLEAQVPVAIQCPPIASDQERVALLPRAKELQQWGVHHALVGTVDSVHWGSALGFTLHGDYGLNLTNPSSLAQWSPILSTATCSFELKFSQIRDLPKNFPLEILIYGHLPLMTTKNCMISNGFPHEKKCTSKMCLTDRKGEQFPVEGSFGGRNMVYNGKPLYLADKQEDWNALGLWGARLCFTRESPEDCVQIFTQYQENQPKPPDSLTRGLYYRGVM